MQAIRPLAPRMTVLVVLIPPRPRPKTRDGLAPPAATEWSWILSVDGQTAAQQGRGTPAEWPRADSVAALLSAADVAWHLVTLPKAPPARLRQALLGVLEDQLLDDDATLHFALPPEPVPGQPTWIAVLHRPWVAECLQRFEAAGRPVDRLVPTAVPGAPPAGHFEPDPEAGGDRLQLTWADAGGALRLGLEGTLARTRTADPAARWTATPAAAKAAEAWLGHPVTVRSEAEQALFAVRSPWNLRQFEFAPRHRGALALRESWQRFLSPAWRPVHVGLAALLLINLVGLNAWAWMQQRALAERRADMVNLLRSTHPQVRAVLDAPRQMARETELLRAAAGQPGDGDLETLLGVAAAAWPEDEAPVASLQFEPGRLVLAIEGWDEARVAAFRDLVTPAGWSVAVAGTQLTLTRGTP
jgi:general secretion pathway protein L